MSEEISDLRNNVEHLNEAEFQQRLDSELSSNYSKADQVDETLMTLGESISIDSLEVPPPTCGSLMLLELIDSPFITGVFDIGGPTLKDVLSALYLLIFRERAISAVAKANHALKALEKLAPIAEKSPDIAERYFASVAENAAGKASFDEEVAIFADSLGQIDVQKVAKTIEKHLTLSLGGFDMLPGDDKKKTGG